MGAKRFFDGSRVRTGRFSGVSPPRDQRAARLETEFVVLVRDEEGRLRGFLFPALIGNLRTNPNIAVRRCSSKGVCTCNDGAASSIIGTSVCSCPARVAQLMIRTY